MTFSIRGRRGSSTTLTMWMREERKPDQMRAIRSVTGGAAAVPAEVMQLIADVRHRGLMYDPATLGIDHGEEVRLVHAGALVQAGEIEELLGPGLTRLLR
jgi:plastocyanin